MHLPPDPKDPTFCRRSFLKTGALAAAGAVLASACSTMNASQGAPLSPKSPSTRRNSSSQPSTAVATPYSKTELYGKGPQRSFTGLHLDQIAFPLGGIGAGQINLGGSGQLQDYSLFNRPAIGEQPRNAAMISVGAAGEKRKVRVLQGPVTHSRISNGGKFNGGSVWPDGYPHMRKATFRGEFPFA